MVTKQVNNRAKQINLDEEISVKDRADKSKKKV